MAGQKIEEVLGRGVPLRGDDIDTDRIIPARFLKCVTFEGLGEHAFEDDIADMKSRGETHPFRDDRDKGATVLVSNKNFGCGSSREHAPQSLKRWGVRCVIAESFSEIFHGNCVALGIPCFTADHDTVEKIRDFVEKNPEKQLFVSVADRLVKLGDYQPVFRLQIKDGARGQFLDGSWNAQAQLMAGAEKVARLASELPYLQWKLHD